MGYHLYAHPDARAESGQRPVPSRVFKPDIEVRQNVSAIDAAPTVQRMQLQFETAPNYAAFIQEAMQRPEEGGRFYATLAYIKCQEIAPFKFPATDHDPQREHARKEVLELKQRCAGVAAQFPSEVTFMAGIKRANSRGAVDPLLPPGGLAPASSPDAATQHIQQAVRSGSPYLLAAALEINVEHYAESLSPAFADGANRELLFRAAAAASCEITGTCASNIRVLVPCATEGDCDHSDLRALLREDLEPAAQELFDQTRKKIMKIGSN
ncbi:hypothetical protein [Pseudoduganella sp. OTU4001]|uniref:hypothetical protein n=1 Tax=Pseudoduganella sp. OTU4001 TaxID=3043854 RepID=UPI00313E9D44